jgi:hypothetical protein
MNEIGRIKWNERKQGNKKNIYGKKIFEIIEETAKGEKGDNEQKASNAEHEGIK